MAMFGLFDVYVYFGNGGVICMFVLDFSYLDVISIVDVVDKVVECVV